MIVHLCNSWSYRLALDVSVMVNTVSDDLVGVHGTVVQNHPHDAAHRAGNHQDTFNTLSVLHIPSLVNAHQEFL